MLSSLLFYFQLATEMLRLFDPTLENQPSPNEEELNLIPIYRNPKIQAASLPGNIFGPAHKIYFGSYSFEP